MEQDSLSAGHGNVGSRTDARFELGYYRDVQDAVTRAVTAHPISDFIDPSRGAHSAWFPSQLAAVAKRTRWTCCGRSTAATTASR